MKYAIHEFVFSSDWLLAIFKYLFYRCFKDTWHETVEIDHSLKYWQESFKVPKKQINFGMHISDIIGAHMYSKSLAMGHCPHF